MMKLMTKDLENKVRRENSNIRVGIEPTASLKVMEHWKAGHRAGEGDSHGSKSIFKVCGDQRRRRSKG